MKKYILTAKCPDKVGIVRAVSDWFFQIGATVEYVRFAMDPNHSFQTPRVPPRSVAVVNIAAFDLVVVASEVVLERQIVRIVGLPMRFVFFDIAKS